MSKIEKKDIGPLESMYLKDALKEYKQSPTVFVIPVDAVEHIVSISEEEIFADSVVMEYVIRVLNEFTVPAIKEIKKLSLVELGLPTRVYNALWRHNVTTEYLIEALQMDKPDMFLAMRNMGPIAIKQVVLALYKYGLPPSVFNPVYDIALVENIDISELLEKGLPQERISAALAELTREKRKNQHTYAKMEREAQEEKLKNQRSEKTKPKQKTEPKGFWESINDFFFGDDE